MKTIQGANIFKAGTWNKQSFSEADLDAIVQAFHDAGKAGRVPLKFGHNEEQALTDGKPALGWVSKLWRQGIDLMADFTDIPDNVYAFIKQGLYKFTSIELLKNAEYSGKRFPYLLDAVALLGAEPPAVDGLADLQKLALSRSSFTFAEVLSFTADHAPIISKFTGDRKTMTPEEIQAAIAKGIADGTKANKDSADALAAERATFAKENETLKAQLAEQAKTIKAEKVKFARESATAIIEAAVRAKKITPAQRLSFTKLFKIDNDDAVLELDLKDVELHTSMTQADAAKVMASGKSAFSKDKGSDDDSSALEGDVQEFETFQSDFVSKVNAHAAKTGKSNFAAMQDVVRLDPKLGKAFLSNIFDSGEAA